MSRTDPPPLSSLQRCTEPYIRYVSNRIGGISASLWMEEANLFCIFEEDWIEAKWDACFGLREFFGSNNAPSFNKQDMQVSRFILEGVHLAIDLCIVLPRRITKLYELFERVVAMNVLIRSHQDGIDPILYLKDLAMQINQPSTSRKLSQCAGKQFADKLHQAFMVPDNSFEAGLLDGLFAIGQGITEPMEVVTYIGAGGEAAC